MLYKMRPDGSQLTPVFGGEIRDVPVMAKGVTLYREPHWTRQSPDGKYYASCVYQQGAPDSKYQGAARAMLCVGGLNGDWSRVLEPNGEEEFAWAPDSTRVAFTITSGRDYEQGYFGSRFRSTEIAVAGIDGSNYDYVLEQQGVWMVCDWSPDGKRLLLRHQRPEDVSRLLEFDLDAALAARAKSGWKGPIARGQEWTAKSAGGFLKRLALPYSSSICPNHARYSSDGKYVALVRHAQSLCR